jgi:predicted transcriptional regulator
MSRVRKNQRSAEDLQIMRALRKGKEDIKAGRTSTHAEVEKMFKEWISK